MSAIPGPEAVGGLDASALLRWVQDQRDPMVDDLVGLVDTETPSDDLPLLEAGLKHVEEWVVRRLGVPATRTHLPSETFGATLVLDYPGTRPGLVACVGHYDTVFDAGTLADWPVRVDGDIVSGPGVFDMKGGLVQMVWALAALESHGVERPTVRLIINGDEEIGSPHSRAIIEKQAEQASCALVFEGSADGGAIKTARKGVGLFGVSVTGVESHAGLDPEAGASAVDEIARVITSLHDAADLSRGTSINIGVVHGGSRANVMAGWSEARMDIRVDNDEEKERVDALLAALTPRDPRCTLVVEGAWNRPVMQRTEGIAAMYDLARAAAQRLGLTLSEAAVGGASDANFVAALGVPVLDGLGGVGAGAHARHEHVSIDGMLERCALAAVVIAALGAEG